MTQHLVPTPEILTLASREVTASALTDRQNIELDRWAQSQMIDAARRAVAADDPAWDRVVGLAMREAVSLTWHNSKVSRTKLGYARVVLATLAAKTPELDLSTVIDLIQAASQDEIKMLNATFMRLNYSRSQEVAASSENP